MAIRRRVARLSTTVALAAALATVPGGVATAASSEPFDIGIGSKAALANPRCDPATGRFRFPFVAAPECVRPWKDGADNGGKVVQGVDDDSVKVVVLWNDLPPTEARTGIFVNQATSSADPEGARNAAVDNNELFASVFETWGRAVELELVRSTGNDEAAQRADAVAVAAMKPFAVIDLAATTGTPGVGGGSIFQQAVLNAGVPYVSPLPQTQTFLSRAWGILVADLLAKQRLASGKAEHAGEELSSTPRKLGIVRSSNFDMEYFERQLRKRDLPIPEDAEFVIPETQSSVRVDAGAAGLDTQIPTLVARLKDAGVTTVIMMANHSVAGAASRAMKTQQWFPEIILTSSPYQDLDLYARMYDQDVWSHAFGLIWFPPYLANAGDPTTGAFQWYWGPNQGTRWSIAFVQMLGLYATLHYLGPDISAERVANRNEAIADAGYFGGAYSDSVLTFEINVPAPGEFARRAGALGWWDPNAQGPGNYSLGSNAKGKYVYLDGGERYLDGDVPTAKQPFFDADEATVMFETRPASEPVIPTYPCNGCPSSGAAPTTAGAAR